MTLERLDRHDIAGALVRTGLGGKIAHLSLPSLTVPWATFVTGTRKHVIVTVFRPTPKLVTLPLI
ncbi:hypothetical protein GCM10010961_05220 [Pseudodonghicola xiamenensis]|uniref:Uncharacterized protein n=1 Tax=Pseudodonghicola xiamenensis TaxID=337702 RepID=A0A8J3H4G2_9RHOB|nr:hypothetical protein GCM10010961_05220 [Pseudodonghicola xiamenensis]